MNIITAFVREQERSRVEEAATALGLSISASGPASSPLPRPVSGHWRGSRYQVAARPVLRLEIPYWGFHVEDAAEQILRAATPVEAGEQPATVWVTTASWFGTSCAPKEAADPRVAHPAFSTAG